jgi:hypothetical protein
LKRAGGRSVPTGRMVGLVGALLVIGAPAVLLRATCAGRSCDDPARADTEVPFCSLPTPLRSALTAGFREGRSPDLYLVDRSSAVFDEDTEVPLIFSGAGVATGAIPPGATLDRIAPTVAEAIGLERSHPEVRSGTALEGIVAGTAPRLVLEVIWKGGDSDGLRAAQGDWPYLQSLMESGAGSLQASPGSLPLDPAATLTTIGTGGTPAQHGITGRVIRADSGKVVRAWGARSPTSVIATLADDLDRWMHQRSKIGLLGNAPSDLGLIGGNWYLRADRDDVVSGGVAAAKRLLTKGYGRDPVPDLVAAVVTGSVAKMDRQVSETVKAASAAADGSILVVFTATGGDEVSQKTTQQLADGVPGLSGVVEATSSGGLFLDQDRMAARNLMEDEIIDGLRRVARGDVPSPVDVFADTAITFSRYC